MYSPTNGKWLQKVAGSRRVTDHIDIQCWNETLLVLFFQIGWMVAIKGITIVFLVQHHVTSCKTQFQHFIPALLIFFVLTRFHWMVVLSLLGVTPLSRILQIVTSNSIFMCNAARNQFFSVMFLDSYTKASLCPAKRSVERVLAQLISFTVVDLTSVDFSWWTISLLISVLGFLAVLKPAALIVLHSDFLQRFFLFYLFVPLLHIIYGNKNKTAQSHQVGIDTSCLN